MSNLPNPAAKALAEIGREIRLWRFGGLSPWRLLFLAIKGYRESQNDARSAQFAYYSLLALAPLLILLIAAVAHLPSAEVLEKRGFLTREVVVANKADAPNSTDVADNSPVDNPLEDVVVKNLIDVADRGLPDNAYEVVKQQILDIQAHSSVSLILGSLFLLGMAGSQVFLTLAAGLNLAFGVKEERRLWQVHGTALLLTILIFLLLLIAMVLLVVGPSISHWLESRRINVPFASFLLFKGARWAVVCGCLLVCSSAIYRLVPSVRLRWDILSPGSVFATVGWVVVSQGFRLYVENFGRYNETYGALGGVIVLVVWLDLTGSILLLGGQINGVIHRTAAAPESKP
ncbi:MAG: YihY/virulence factor BrkB family protein [Planctomycetales bacterium]|nr:YihY/virulence factor BrkB family protein [Planctomycetales bacterium]